MKKEINHEKIIEELQHASPAKPGKRFQSFFVDCLLVIFLSYFVFLGTNAIAKSTSSYKESEEIVKEEIKYYNDFVAKSRAVEFEIINGEQIRKTDIYDKNTGVSKIILENINRAIYQSYVIFGDFSTQYGTKISSENMELIKSSVSENGQEYDDNISYFYSNYLLNVEGTYDISFTTKEAAQKHIQKVYQGAFGSDATTFFSFDLEKSGVPILKMESAYYLYYFLYVAEDSDITTDSENYYYLFDTAYNYMLSEAENIMIKSEPYYSTHYAVYYENNAVIGRATNIALLVSIIIGYLIVVLIPKVIFKHERTLGRLLFKLGSISVYDEPINWKITTIKTILGCFGYLASSFIIYMFKPFNGSFGAMFMPFIGDTPLLFIIGIIILLVIVNSTVMLFTRNKVGIDGLLLGSILVDRKNLDELEVE